MRENNIFTQPIKAVNIGVKLLGDALKDQKVDVIPIDWRPPRMVHLSSRIMEILARLEEDA